MNLYDFYSDRSHGQVPRTSDELPEATSQGLQALVKSKADTGWFAQRFPEKCPDGQGVVGTDFGVFWRHARAYVPRLPERPSDTEMPDDALLDLLEFATRNCAEPSESRYHSFFHHWELEFDQDAGRRIFRGEINEILHRGGTTYELDLSLRIVRPGPPAVQEAAGQLRPSSGDQKLDDDLNEALHLYSSKSLGDRTLAIERLWDGFERLKTIDVHGNKQASSTRLLKNIENEPMRAVVEAEMRVLTDLGNNFTIRHHETNRHPVPENAQDYLFVRMTSLITFLLQQSGRLE